MRNLLISVILILLFSFFGCMAKVVNKDNASPYKEKYLGKSFKIEYEYFLVNSSEDVIKEQIIEVPGNYSGIAMTPTKEQYMKNPDSVNIFGKDKIIGIEGNDIDFKIIHVMAYIKGPSNNFIYLVVESLKSKKSYAILRASYEHGIKSGYIKLLQ